MQLQQRSGDSLVFHNLAAFFAHIEQSGYHSDSHLLTASIKKFQDYCSHEKTLLSNRLFSIAYTTSIPYQVGFAGSSAIIIACLRGLMAFYDVHIPAPQLAELALRVETEELGIPGGLQDRVAQVYQGLTYMDFDQALMQRNGCGYYESLALSDLPNLYIAYRDTLAEGSEVFHHNLRARFERGEPDVLSAIEFWKALTLEVKSAITLGNTDNLGHLMNQNFDRRAELYSIGPGNLQMINVARAVGASAKFTGSGGAVIGTYNDEKMYQELSRQFAALNINILKPSIVK